jgi:hypothetical protein
MRLLDFRSLQIAHPTLRDSWRHWAGPRSIFRLLFLAREQRRERLLAVPLCAPGPRNISSATSGNRDWVVNAPFLHSFNISILFW